MTRLKNSSLVLVDFYSNRDYLPITLYISSKSENMKIKNTVSKRRLGSKLCVFMLLLIGVVTSANAELKVGVYDQFVVLRNLPLLQAESDRLKAEFEPTEREISEKTEALNALQESINSGRGTLSEVELRSLSQEFQSKRRDLQLLVEDSQHLAKARRNEVVIAVQKMIEQEVRNIAKEEGYDLILHSGVLHASPAVDITQKVLQRLSQAQN